MRLGVVQRSFTSSSADQAVRHMNDVLRFFTEELQHQFGMPSAMRRKLATIEVFTGGSLEPKRSIDAESVVRWTDLGDDFHTWPRLERGRLRGWHLLGGHYESTSIYRPEYEVLERVELTDRWHCDISELDGFTSSKSVLADFESTDEMVETNSKEMIDLIDSAKLAKNLAHDEIRILHRDHPSDHFIRFAWDGRLFLANSGGSHHLAAAKYIAKRLNTSVKLSARLHTYSLNAGAVESLCRDFEMMVVDDSPAVWLEMSDALQAFRATWFHHKLPRQAGGYRVILLPTSQSRSRRAAIEFRRAGVPSFNELLAALISRQVEQLAAWSRR